MSKAQTDVVAALRIRVEELEKKTTLAREALLEVEHERDFVVRCNDYIRGRVSKTLDMIGRRP